MKIDQLLLQKQQIGDRRGCQQHTAVHYHIRTGLRIAPLLRCRHIEQAGQDSRRLFDDVFRFDLHTGRFGRQLLSLLISGR